MKLSDFQILGGLGRGGFGEVVMARSKKDENQIVKNQIVAIKVIAKRLSTSARAEIDTLNKVKAKPFLSQMLNCFQDRTDVFIILRYEENGSLANLLQRRPILVNDFAQRIIVEVVLALEYLHNLEIVHGDLKPENILLDQNFRTQVADFGLSRIIQGHKFTGVWGTLKYQSPEQLKENEPWDGRVDFFSAGVILFEMVSGMHPFEEDDATDDDVYKNIIELKYKMPNLYDPSAISFIQQTLCLQNKRLFGQAAVQHQYIACKIPKIISSFEWAPAIIYNGNHNDETYFDNHCFYNVLSGIDFDGPLWGKSESQNKNEEQPEVQFPQLQDVRRNERSTTKMLEAKLAKVPGADRCRISKVNNNYYVRCECNQRLKAIFQTKKKETQTKLDDTAI